MCAVAAVSHGGPLPQKEKDPIVQDALVAFASGRVLDAKEQLMLEAPKKDWADTAVLVSGDIFTVGYFGLDTAMKYIPAVAASSGAVFASFVCGEIAGAINIAVSLVSLKQALQAFYNGDNALGRRMLWDAVTGILLGAVMILLSTALKVSFAAGLIGVLSSPWVYPVLFLLAMAYVVYELAGREAGIWTKKDIAGQLKLDDWQKRIEKGDFSLPDFFKVDAENMNQAELLRHVIEKVEVLQADMGVEAAIKACRVWQNVLMRKQADALVEMRQLKERIAEWNRAQHIRSAQQALYILGIMVSLIGLAPRVSTTATAAINNGGLFLANGIALGMDAGWKFKRNTPIVVPKVETVADVFARISKKR